MYVLESLQQRKEELLRNNKEIQELDLNSDLYKKFKETERLIEKAEREKKSLLPKEAEMEMVKGEHATLTEKKQELEHQVQKLSVYGDLMEQLLKKTEFEDVEALADHLEGVLHFKCQLSERESKAQEQADELRKLKEQHSMLLQQRNNQLSRLQTELEETRSEALIWERKWSHIQETAAEPPQKRELGQIKMATLNLYEMTGGHVGGAEGVDVNDTEEQLEQVKKFIEDQTDTVKRHRQKHRGQRGHKIKKPTPNKEL